MTTVTMRDPCPPKTRVDLEWDRLLGALAGRCSTSMGRDLANQLPFLGTREEARLVASEAEEATRLLVAGTPLPSSGLPELRGALTRIAGGVLLGSVELRDTVSLLRTGRALRRFLALHREACQALSRTCSSSESLDAVASEISGCFEPDGVLADKASPGLRDARCASRAARARLMSKLEQIMSRHEHLLQERFVTERDGCWVIPVKAAAVRQIPGTVHGASSSGSTVFLEPEAVAPLTIKLHGLEAEVEREELAVYTRLSALLSQSADAVEACARAVARADLRGATARLARDLGLTFPRLLDASSMTLHELRHPLLVLDLQSGVVGSDVTIEGGAALVISGPNAGGKTVTLKAMGMAALMARAGLPVACSPGTSEIGLFDIVLTDVGDDQNLRKNLSTFSAHATNVARILDETGPGALVLLDELASGTDPREGEALACGVLVSLCARGGAVVVTTHYEGLKALAFEDPRFRNASVSFDFETMTPTFRVNLGVPGGSSALVVAARFGIPAVVIERARGFLSREALAFERVVNGMLEAQSSLDAARVGVLASRAELDATRLRIEMSEALRQDSRLGDAGGEATRAAAPAAAAAPALALKKGMSVYVPRLKRDAQVLETLSGGNVRVTAGSIKMVLATSEIELPRR